MAARIQSDAQAFEEAVEALDNIAAGAMGGAERLDHASCSPAITYLAEVGIGAAARGCSREGWRTEVAKTQGPEAAKQLDEAEECMRHSGLWPWN